MHERTGLNWAELANRYAAANPISIARIPEIFVFRDIHPLEITRALAPADGASAKPELADFFMLALEEAASDHIINDAEAEELEQVAKLLRIEEGDLLREHSARIRVLLCKEISFLLQDLHIDPEEALYKVRLQRLLRLGYDTFTDLISQEIEKVIALLVDALGAGSLQELSPESVDWIRIRLNALDKVFKMHSETFIRNITNFDT